MANIVTRRKVLHSLIELRTFTHVQSKFWRRSFSNQIKRTEIRSLRSVQPWGRSFSGQIKQKPSQPKLEHAIKLDGKKCANAILDEIRLETAELKKEYNEVPGLAVIQVGGRLDSSKYVQMKRNTMRDLGFNDFGQNMPEQVTQDAILSLIDHLNHNPKVHGILVQLPLPPQFDSNTVTRAILPRKDVDGFHPNNVGLMTLKNVVGTGEMGIQPCTPKGCIELLDRYGVDLNGKNAVVLGRSNIVGHPLATLLLHRNCTVTICHSRTKNISEISQKADILIAALGIPRFVKKEWIKPGAVVIDVGVNFAPDPRRGNKRRMCGDVDYDDAKFIASAITPVPGGVGPMTVAMLMKNTLENAKSYCNRYYRPPWFMNL